MKTFRRNFLKTFFISFLITPFVKLDYFFSYTKKKKLKKDKGFIWYLNDYD